MDDKSPIFIFTFVLILISLIRGIVTQEDPQSASFVNYSLKDGMCDWESISAAWKIGEGSPTTSGTGTAHDHTLRKDKCVFDVRFCNWIQRTSDGFRWIRTYGASFPRTTSPQSGPANKTTDPQSARINTTTGPQSGRTNKTTGPQIHHTTKKTTPQNGPTNKTTDPQSARINTTTGPQSGRTNKTTNPQIHRTTKKTTPQSGPTNKTTDPQSARTIDTTGPQSGHTNKTTVQQSHRTTKKITPKSGCTNKTTDPQCARTTKTTDPQSARTTKKTDPQSGRTSKTTNPQRVCTNKTGTRATSTTRDLKESSFSVGWVEAFTTTAKPADGRQITSKGHNPKVTVEVITVSLVGAVMFVLLSLLVGVWICRKRRRRRKMVEPFELKSIAPKPSSRDDERGYSSSAANCINPGNTHSSNASSPGNKALTNGETDDANYKYASGFQSTTPEYWRDDTYDHTGDETKPPFDGAYDHIPTHFVEEYDATHFTIRTRLDACETYDHVTICPDDVYDETCVAQASTIQYKTYEHVTKGTCETPVSKPNISNSQDNIYEFVA